MNSTLDIVDILPKPVLIEDLGRLYPTEGSKQKFRYGLYKCGFCGTEFKAIIASIKNGQTKSCGCYHKKRIRETKVVHNLSSTKLYKIWKGIRQRILNPRYKNYEAYGGRGITICEEWKNDFMSFYDWAMSNGYKENGGLSIDRINNDGNYEPSNCRWTTKFIQNRNKRIFKNNTSGYKGVSYDNRVGKFQVSLKYNLKKIYLGYFETAEEGAVAYNNYIIENNLEGFILNEIPEECLI